LVDYRINDNNLIFNLQSLISTSKNETIGFIETHKVFSSSEINKLSASNNIKINYRYIDDPKELHKLHGIVRLLFSRINKNDFHFLERDEYFSYYTVLPSQKSIYFEALGGKGSLHQTIQKSRDSLLISIILIALLIAILNIISIRLIFVKPLKKLIGNISKINESNYHDLYDINTLDEIGDISKSFTEMAALVSKREAQLKTFNENLEKTIKDRTEELRLEKNKADAANKAKSQFLANMSHELRTPMHSVISFSNLALKRVENEKIEHYLQNIRTSGIRLTTLLNDLLDLSKLEAGRMQAEFIEQDLTTLIKQAVSEVSSLLSEKNILINLDSDNNINCMVDQKLMIQVVVNLLSNAIKFSPENSTINIAIQLIKSPFDQMPQDIVKLSVTDQGVGIPSEEIETVFDKFTQSTKTMTNAGGTGLGLSITQEIINLHHGKIHAESPPLGKDIGARFIVEIPVLQVEASQSDFDNIQDAIDLHINWKKHLDEVLDKKELPPDLSASIISNENLCALGMWINSNVTENEAFIQLKRAHKEFHHLASECVAYCQVNDISNAADSKEKYDMLSQEIIQLVRKLGGT
jgi:signal transduction histidine kinase